MDGDESIQECIIPEGKTITQVYLTFLFLWQTLFHISDSAITILLTFTIKFLSLTSRLLHLERLKVVVDSFPRSLYHARKFLGRLHEKFIRYSSCPTCHNIYPLNESWTMLAGKKCSKTCSFVRFPQHTQMRMRQPCGTALLKTMTSSRGTRFLYPKSLFCYLRPQVSLAELLSRPDAVAACKHWKPRRSVAGVYSDVYDGNIWKNFFEDSGRDGFPFLAEGINLMLSLNIDWFQPYKHTAFSVGVMYLAVLNLPRELRFRKENILIVGIIPGPSEPRMTINSYLKPLVDDFQQLWVGVKLLITGKLTTVRAALTCLACDVPAARKAGGFVGHGGRMGCSKCLKIFPTEKFGDKPDYSGFKKTEWEPRSHALHVWYAHKQKNARTLEQAKEIERTHGARYSCLYKLPYYNAIDFCIIDPMHCLFLGISKLFFSVWKQRNLIEDKHFRLIQTKVDSFVCPSDIGRIPYKIASGFSGFKADQWKSWTLHFSLFALKDLLPFRDYNCWLNFVKVCSLLCRRTVQESELTQAEESMEQFCTQFEQLYGKESLTPNIHLMFHITDCIRDHGPVYGFWLYAFERMNGILGNFPTNNHEIGIQLMRKFSVQKDFNMYSLPEDIMQEFQPLLEQREMGSVLETSSADSNSTSKSFRAIPPVHEKSFSDAELLVIKSVLNNLYQGIDIDVLRLYRQASALQYGNSQKLEVSRYPHTKCSKVFINNKLIEITSFMNCTVIVKSAENPSNCHTNTHWLLTGQSYMEHPCRKWYGGPTEVWASATNSNVEHYLVQDITHRTVSTVTKASFGRIIGEDTVVVASLQSFNS